MLFPSIVAGLLLYFFGKFYLERYRIIKSGEAVDGRITGFSSSYSAPDPETQTSTYEGQIYKAVYWNTELGREVEAECSYSVKKHFHRIGDKVTIVPHPDKPDNFVFTEDEEAFRRKPKIFFSLAAAAVLVNIAIIIFELGVV